MCEEARYAGRRGEAALALIQNPGMHRAYSALQELLRRRPVEVVAERHREPGGERENPIEGPGLAIVALEPLSPPVGKSSWMEARYDCSVTVVPLTMQK